VSGEAALIGWIGQRVKDAVGSSDGAGGGVLTCGGAVVAEFFDV
jgi:hypothetical protein